MLLLEKEFRTALTQVGFRLASDTDSVYSGELGGVQAQVTMGSGTGGTTGAAWSAITITVEDPRVVGECKVIPGAFFSTQKSMEQYPTWAQVVMTAAFIPVAPVMAVGMGVMTGIVWAANTSQGLEGHSEVEITPFRQRFNLWAPSHEAAAAGCPESLQKLLLELDFVGSFSVTPGTFSIRPMLWTEKSLNAFVENVPRLVQCVCGVGTAS